MSQTPQRCAKAHPSTRVPELQSHEARQAVTAAVGALLQRWGLQDATQAELLGILDMGSVHKTGLLPDDAAVLERAGHLLAIGRALDRLYPDQPAAVAWWMRAPYQDFGGLSALTLMRTGVDGIKRVRTHIESWLKTPATE